LNVPALAPPDSKLVLRAMHAVATSSGRRIPLPIERELLLAVQRTVLGSRFDVDALAPIQPRELRAALRDPDQRAWLVRCAVLVPYVSLEADPAKVAAADAIAMQLGTPPLLLHDLHTTCAALAMRVARDHARRGARLFLTVHASQPLRGIADALAQHRGDAALAARYRSLAALPPSSLGRSLFELYRRDGMVLPGERGALDDSLVARDLLRVLGGFALDGRGEQETIGFVAGVARLALGRALRLDAVAEVCMAAQLAGTLTGATPPRLDLAAFDAAYDRGVVASAELGHDWPWWSVIGEDLTALRLRYGIRVVRPVPAVAVTAAATASRAA
jgi:hypothetical protein